MNSNFKRVCTEEEDHREFTETKSSEQGPE